MAKNETKFGPEAQFSEPRGGKDGKPGPRLSITITQKQYDAIDEVVKRETKSSGVRQTRSSWGLRVILEALKKEGYKDW